MKKKIELTKLLYEDFDNTRKHKRYLLRIPTFVEKLSVKVNYFV